MTSLLQSSSQFLHTRSQYNSQPLILPRTPLFVSLPSLRQLTPKRLCISSAAPKKHSENLTASMDKKNSYAEDETEEVEEDMLWIQEKALDLVEFTGSVTQAIPGPRVGSSKLPWMLAVPLAYAGVTFVAAFIKTVKKFSSPKAKRKKLVNQNAMLCRPIDELLGKEGKVNSSDLMALEQKTGFNMEGILRKYIRYALNEKPFNPDLVADLIQLRRASGLNDSQIPEILNEFSRRIVKEKGPVVMKMQGFTEKGFKRKLAVQALFGKIYYLSELPDFCSKDNSLIVKEIFGVADEDAEKLRIHALNEAGDMEALEKMVEFEKTEVSSSDKEDEEDDWRVRKRKCES